MRRSPGGVTFHFGLPSSGAGSSPLVRFAPRRASSMSPTPDRPWLRFYGDVPRTIDYPRVTLYEAVRGTAERQPEAVAWDFFGTEATYRELLESIDRCADSLASLALEPGDRLLI